MRKPDLDDFFKSESYVEEDDNPAEEESIPDRGIPHTPPQPAVLLYCEGRYSHNKEHYYG